MIYLLPLFIRPGRLTGTHGAHARIPSMLSNAPTARGITVESTLSQATVGKHVIDVQHLQGNAHQHADHVGGHILAIGRARGDLFVSFSSHV